MTEFLSYIEPKYSQICQNIYLFDTIDKEDFHNIYIEYNTALNEKERNVKQAIILFNKCIDLLKIKLDELILNNDYINSLYKDILYESYVNLALIYTNMDTNNNNNNINNNEYFEIIKSYYEKASQVYLDRAEPYFYFGIYCNKINKFNDAYISLMNAKNKDFSLVFEKYPTAQKSAYGDNVNEELNYTYLHMKN